MLLESNIIPPEARQEPPCPPGRTHLHSRSTPLPIQLETTGRCVEASDTEFWSPRTAHRFSIAAKLREAGAKDLAEKLEDCHSHAVIQVCRTCGRTKRLLNHCDLFLCPECQPHLARRRQEEIEWWFVQCRQPKHVVLTMRNTTNLTRGHVSEIKAAFRRLRQSKFSRNWKGGCYALEVTNEGRGWHLHLHILVEAAWIDGGQLAIAWNKATRGAGHIVKVLDARKADYLAELAKYVVKGSQVAKWTPAEVIEFAEAFARARTFSVFGRLYGLRTQYRAWLDSISQKVNVCECGSADLAYYDEAEWLARGHTATETPQSKPRGVLDPTPDLFADHLRAQAHHRAVAR